MPHTQMVAEQVITQWVMEARHSSMAEDMSQEDVVQPMVGVETRSQVSVVLPLIEPNVVPTENELPSSLPTIPTANDDGRP